MITPQALEIIESKFPDGTFVYTNSEQTGMRIALTNPPLLKANGLHTTEELNSAREQGKREGCTCDMCEFIAAEKAMGELGVKQETDESMAIFFDLLRSIDFSGDYVDTASQLKSKFTITRK